MGWGESSSRREGAQPFDGWRALVAERAVLRSIIGKRAMNLPLTRAELDAEDEIRRAHPVDPTPLSPRGPWRPAGPSVVPRPWMVGRPPEGVDVEYLEDVQCGAGTDGD